MTDISQSGEQSATSARAGLRGRLMRGLGATALSPVVAAVIQLGSVPLLLHAWGTARYGDWLLLSAIPMYLTLSDLGFGDASGSDMAMRVAANDKPGALRTFQSSWVLVSVVSLAALLTASLVVWHVPWQHWLRLSTVGNFQAAIVLLVLAAWVVVAQQNGVTESGYRCDGNFAIGTLWSTLQRLAEVSIATTIALLGGSLIAVACAYLLTRSVATIAYALLLRYKSPWLSYGFKYADWQTIRELSGPAFGFIAFPLGQALSFQGFTIVVGALLGPLAVVAFSTLRTLSRLNFQLIAVFKHAFWPELSMAFGAGDIALARRLHRHACQASLALSVAGGAFLWIAGPYIYHFWVRQHVAFDAVCFHVLLLAVITNSLWDTSAVIPMSVNGHLRIAVIYAGAALASLGLAWILTPRLGITGAALALLATDVWMTGLVLRTTLRQVQDSLKKFVAALFVIPAFRQAIPATPEA